MKTEIREVISAVAKIANYLIRTESPKGSYTLKTNATSSATCTHPTQRSD